MTSARISTFLHFTGQASDAVAHYASVFGSTVSSQTFGEFGMVDDPADADLVMHAQLDGPDGLVLMCSDVPTSMRVDGAGPAQPHVCLFGDDEERLRGWWEGLADGGTVRMPLEKAPWGDHFGQLEDRFGVSWMVNISPTG